MKRLIILAATLTLALSIRAETYTIDPVHSSVGFSIRHLVSKFSSSFTKVSGAITYDAAVPEKSTVDATVEISSVNTANDMRNGHLLDAEHNFFNVAKFPTATFKSTAWKKTGESTFDVAGDLTIKGITKPVVFTATLLGTGPGMGGVTLTGWEVTAKINKSDFGVNGPAMLGKALGDEVTLNIAIEAGYKPAAK